MASWSMQRREQTSGEFREVVELIARPTWLELRACSLGVLGRGCQSENGEDLCATELGEGEPAPRVL